LGSLVKIRSFAKGRRKYTVGTYFNRAEGPPFFLRIFLLPSPLPLSRTKVSTHNYVLKSDEGLTYRGRALFNKGYFLAISSSFFVVGGGKVDQQHKIRARPAQVQKIQVKTPQTSVINVNGIGSPRLPKPASEIVEAFFCFVGYYTPRFFCVNQWEEEKYFILFRYWSISKGTLPREFVTYDYKTQILNFRQFKVYSTVLQ
jgi:hypothetical protein